MLFNQRVPLRVLCRGEQHQEVGTNMATRALSPLILFVLCSENAPLRQSAGNACVPPLCFILVTPLTVR